MQCSVCLGQWLVNAVAYLNNRYWKSELFSEREAFICCLGGFFFLLIVVFLPGVDDPVWRLAAQMVVGNCHLLLVVRASRCRNRWRLDFASYMDVMCLIGGFFIAPVYCLLTSACRKT